MAFLNSLNYQTEEIIVDKETDLNLPERANAIIKSIALISDYKTDGAQFRIYTIEVEPSHLRRTDIRTVLEPFYIRFPHINALFVFTTRKYNPLVLVSPQRVLSPEDRTKTKLKLRILRIDRDNVYHTDLEVLNALKLTPGEVDPSQIWMRHLDAFSIERVTEEFFKTYKEKFDCLKDALESNKRENIVFEDEKYLETFAQRILGRLIFLYFLQKKGWLNGDKKFVSNLLDRAEEEHKNFYNDFLEPLFFEVLNKRRPNDESPFGTIPYLNGGLFEKDYKYNFEVKLPNAIFREIIDFFNRYNFTVQENTPLEVEVSLDPELLGKIFENMLAEKERGEKGTFYTPRPVVHYMCRESLKEYLAAFTDIARHKVLALVEDSNTEDLSGDEAKRLYEALDKVRILDPAVGSGAFLVGLMHEIIRLKTALAEKSGRRVTNAQLKREIIKFNLHGVDIEPEAIEIAMLRLWLSLVVDEELEDAEPLPNLEHKLRVGNSLVESWRGRRILGEKGFQRTFGEDKTQKLIEELKDIRDELVTETDVEKRKNLRERSEKIEWELIEKELSEEAERKTREAIEIGRKYKWVKKGIPKKEGEKLKRLKEEAENAGKLLKELKQSGEKSFFLPQIHFAEVYKEKGGFDIVIANPPYVRTQKLSKLPYRDDLKLHYGFIDDFYVHFTFRAFELARPKGIVTFITSDTYLTLAWKERMRELLQDNRIRRLILTPKAFQATVNTAIYIAQRERLADYNFTFLDAREVGGNDGGSWEDKLIAFEGLKEIKAYDTQNAIRIGDKELEVSYSRQADIEQFRVPVELYKKAVKRVFFTPTEKNLKLYEQFMPKMKELYDKWWSKIKSSKDIQKNRKEIEQYLRTLKPGDVTLLGLITEGGQGLATADNGRFLAVLEGTGEAKRIEERLEEFESNWARNEPKIFEKYQELLAKHSRNDALDKLRKKFGEKKLGLPRGFIYKVIKKEDVFDAGAYLESLAPEIRDIMRRVLIFGGVPEKESDVKSLWKLPKLGDDLKTLDTDLKKRVEEEYGKLKEKGRWIAFTRGGEAENIFWSSVDRFIDWSRASIKELSTSSKARWQGYEHFLEEGITYVDIGGAEIKARILSPSIYDHTAHSFFPDEKHISPKYLLGILNTTFASYFANEFLNHTMHFELNDIRLFPIVIPTETQRKEIEALVDEAIEIQKKRYASEKEDEKSELWKELQEVQERINEEVWKIYAGFLKHA